MRSIAVHWATWRWDDLDAELPPAWFALRVFGRGERDASGSPMCPGCRFTVEAAITERQ